MRTSRAAAGTAVALLVVVAGCGADSGGSSPGVDDSAADCSDSVLVGDVGYEREDYNDGVLSASSLGARLGVVESSDCADTGGEVTLVGEIQATWLPVGTELFEIAGYPGAERIAAVLDGEVVVYGSAGAYTATDAGDVARIEVRSNWGGRTALATIDDHVVVEQLVADFNNSRPRPDTEWSGVSEFFIAFVNTDGLASVSNYDLHRNLFLDGRRPGSVWKQSVSEALRTAPDQPVFDRFTVSGGDGEAVFHPMGGCLLSRPELAVDAGEALKVVNTTGGEISYIWVITGGRDEYGIDVAERISLRPFTGTVMIEIELVVDDETRNTICTVVETGTGTPVTSEPSTPDTTLIPTTSDDAGPQSSPSHGNNWIYRGATTNDDAG